MSSINLLELVDGAQFPMTKAELVAFCEDKGASEEALDMIHALPHEEIESFSMFNREIGLIGQLPGGRMNSYGSSKDA